MRSRRLVPCVHRTTARLRTLLGEQGDFATVLRGAGIVVIIRILASAVGFATMILLARWMGSSEYGLYSFAITSMTLLAYPATLGLAGAAVPLVAQQAAANDWQHVVGFMKVSSWLAFCFGALVATLAIGAVLASKSYLDPAYVAPTIVALAGIPIVALSIVRSEAIRGLGWLAVAWGPLQLGQPVFLLVVTAILLFIVMQLTATMAVGASIVAYVANLIVQWGVLHARLGTVIRVEPKIQLGLWLGVAVSFVWISLATLVLLQAGVIVVGIFLKPQDVAIFSAAAATSGFVTLPKYAAAALGSPKFATLEAQQRRPELQALFTKIVRLTFWTSVAIALIYVVFGSMVLHLFGPGFEQGYPTLLILTLGQLSSAFVGPVANLLTMTGHHAVTARVLTMSAILAVVFGLVFTPIWGSVGTAVAFSAAMVLSNALLTILVVRRLEIFAFTWSFECARRRVSGPHE
jgi:O-antigen/teichoic acid export membrane protein